MKAIAPHPLTLNGRDPEQLRGDPMSGDRYYSPEFAHREWEQLWTKIWHVAGRTQELLEAGDYVVHDFMGESVFCVKQDDGGIKAFYNVCQHRGMRLVSDSGSSNQFHCPYHGWVWGRDGVLQDLCDPEDFPQGNPCNKLKLNELRCDTWGGLVWYTMNDRAPALLDYLAPLPELYKNYPMETAVRVFARKIRLNCNWKFSTDNFSESYHTRTAHPQVPPWIDQDYWSARSEMFPNGHGRTVQPMRPSLRDLLPDGEPHPFDQLLRMWDIDPDSYPDFATKAMQGWLDLKAAKRNLWRERGYVHYADMNDEELTDSPHTVIFPNVTISFLPDNLIFFRSEPDAKDPTKCTFDLWCMAFPVAGQTAVDSVMAGVHPLEEAEPETCDFDGGRGVPEIVDSIVWQDMMLAEGQQRGWQSRGYRDSYLAGQETRVRYFHEVLNDYLEGRR
ncbi:aromatic ring-hydroxylating dioxygenase subunit alpha [Pseudomaricurvus alcaniphilus]|uniref:aromatic ring-hydroxylating oxygenase subunit alpha n=1 Tax=Pseudomaricurvus alcaniphilus TaxID=1166482 RepID=UPI00140AE154|nr:aromatic ring-hydroxylating dioxygenase subunit alpha [Pseudomaricurvus alcaniphilus]NHN39211.1 aromatic ring-hydroxylating dioxygenase subunit alpha [Pseudomaricurvus alcaniphilus]